MGQPKLLQALPLLAMLVAVACDRKSSAPAPPGARPRVASLVPAATDLLIGMGAGDHLVAISNYDPHRDETRALPRVGDYQTFDWEQIAALRPDVMIVFMASDRMPPGLSQRARQLDIRLVNIRTERLSEILNEIGNLGRAVEEDAKATRAVDTLRAQIAAAARQTAGRPKARALIVRDKSAEGVVGRDSFLNDILEAAGGQNVITASGWPSIDREMLLSLKPEVIIQLLPDASPQVIAEANRVWTALPQIPAVANRRVHILTDWYVQQSGFHVGELAVRFAGLLHPETAQTRPVLLPSSQPTTGEDGK